ncbi:MAG: hypothetical protein IT355_12130 [Gemmatimonadaceae bacterium]|nr:hypothetical protein [Gemmatimonadaceae bacterium]
MNWIRVATTIKNDPSVHAIAAECCRGDIAKAVGHVVAVLAECSTHARTGDLRAVQSLTLEEWAVWRGKSGALDKAIRSHLCTDGVLRSWDKYNGAPIRENEAHRARMKARREANRDQ